MEGDGLKRTYFPASICAHLLVSDGSLIVDFIPTSSDVIATFEHTPINVITGCFLGLHGDTGRLVGTHLHAEAVSLAGLPHMTWRIDKELRVPCIFRVINRVDLDATRTVETHTVGNCTIHIVGVIAILTHEAGGIVTLAVTVCNPVCPGRLIALIMACIIL